MAVGFFDRIRFWINRMQEHLWVKPLLIGVLSIAIVFAAKIADSASVGHAFPMISSAALENLLSIMATSMLPIATFAVASMVSAYSSASNNASPRSFSLVISDDISQRALSTFIGAFIFSTVGAIATKNSYFHRAGHFVMFVFTLIVFGLVILTFVHWVDRIARLGRLGNTISRVEKVTAAAMQKRRLAPTLGGVQLRSGPCNGQALFCDKVGYLQRIELPALQEYGEKNDVRIRVGVLPGSFITPNRPVAHIESTSSELVLSDMQKVIDAFRIGTERLFDDDPRYGLVVLAQIADRALSPAVNDSGTAIDVIGVLSRLFVLWGSETDPDSSQEVKFDRVTVPVLSVQDMFDDAFTAIERDGSGQIEVALRLQKALSALASMGDKAMGEAALQHARKALELAVKALSHPEDVSKVREQYQRLFDVFGLS